MHSKKGLDDLALFMSNFFPKILGTAVFLCCLSFLTGCAAERPKFLGGKEKPRPVCTFAVNKPAATKNQFLPYKVKIKTVIVPANISEAAKLFRKIAFDTAVKRRCFAKVEMEGGTEVKNSWVNFNLNEAEMVINVPYILHPVGDSSGKIGVEVILKSKDGELLWESYGEALLSARRWKDYILFQDHYKPAPSIQEGFSAIFEKTLVMMEKGNL